MPITRYPEYNQPKIIEACLGTVPDGTNLITVGHNKIYEVSYANGAAINALAADAWTDIQDINLGVPFIFQLFSNSGGDNPLGLGLTDETVGDYIRAQWELDGIAILDITVGPNKSQHVEYFHYQKEDVGRIPHVCMFAGSRFRVRLYKHGTIDQAGSYIRIGAIGYTQVGD